MYIICIQDIIINALFEHGIILTYFSERAAVTIQSNKIVEKIRKINHVICWAYNTRNISPKY